MLARDEMANMVWGVERTVPLPSGEPKAAAKPPVRRALFSRDLAGLSAHRPRHCPRRGRQDPLQGHESVPENWIPMISVHIPNDIRETQLQRAAMLRIFEGDQNPTPAKGQPRTSLLRQGLDERHRCLISCMRKKCRGRE